jgi:hypothetical protein|tara:strand:- start:305 stop:586 length:282 start_codon:yes stop_codon:yes gene_type:complete
MFKKYTSIKEKKIKLGDVVYDALAKQLKIPEKVGVVIEINREQSFVFNICRVKWIGYLEDLDTTKENMENIRNKKPKWILEIELKVLVSAIDE